MSGEKPVSKAFDIVEAIAVGAVTELRQRVETSVREGVLTVADRSRLRDVARMLGHVGDVITDVVAEDSARFRRENPRKAKVRRIRRGAK